MRTEFTHRNTHRKKYEVCVRVFYANEMKLFGRRSSIISSPSSQMYFVVVFGVGHVFHIGFFH